MEQRFGIEYAAPEAYKCPRPIWMVICFFLSRLFLCGRCRDLTVKLEGRILKLYDKDNNLIQEIEM